MNTVPQPALFDTVRFYPAEREVFRKKEDISTAGFAEKYRQVTMGAHTGPWRNDISPHLVKIMDTWDLPYVREVVVVKSPQTGGTQIIYNCEAHSMKSDPSTAMIVMPNQEMARKVAEDRIIPMIRQTPPLAALISDNPDDTAKQRIKLANSELLYMAWANSTSALATFPIKRVYFDETDKYPPTVGKETDPISLGEKRCRTFRYTHKILKVSTPTREDGPIWKAFRWCDVRYGYHARCPDCGAEQLFVLGNLHIPEARTPEAIRRDHLAWYECEACRMHWNDYQRDAAVRAGRWKLIWGKNILRPRRVAFHMPSWISTDVSLSEIAAAYLVAKTDRARLIDFNNDYLAEPFIESEEGESVSEDVLYKRRRDYAPEGADWQVPMGACLLTCAIDVQKNRLEVDLTAWGPGFESWGIEYRAFPGDPSVEFGNPGSPWNDLADYLSREWVHESGARLRIATAAVDSGYLAPVVYRFVRQRQARRVYAVKGSSARAKALVSIPSPKALRNRVKDRYRVTLVTVGTETAKDALLQWMQTDAPGPGHMHYHTGYGLDYFRQMTAEQQVTRYDKGGRPYRVWVKKHRDARNEALDLRVYNYAVLDLLNPDFKKLEAGLWRQVEANKEAPKEEKPAPPPKKVSRATGRKRGGWMKGWKK